MAKPYTSKRILLTPKTANVILDAELKWCRSVALKGNLGGAQVDFELTAKEVAHLAGFFTLLAERTRRKR